jgi:4-hydroxythreonine-4-phosphate dehydrogenase
MTVADKPIAVTMGEPAGIGGELTLKAWHGRQKHMLPTFFAIDDPHNLGQLAQRLGWSVPIVEIETPDAAHDVFPTALPVLPLALHVPSTPGTPDVRNAGCSVASVRKAVDLVRAGQASALVTNPVHKTTLYEAGFQHPGHTEYLAELAGVSRSVMMLACPGLRVVPVTAHVGLADAISRLSRKEIVAVGRVTAEALRGDFGIDHPRIMVAGLNPHAGEDGALGREEIETIAPAVADLKGLGIVATGPVPADTLFHERAREGYDAAICMYHDQALIPLKTIDFHGGVNITLGLPFVRTSPDHGTAFEIAGLGVADVSSLAASITLAAEIAGRRLAAAVRGKKAIG